MKTFISAKAVPFSLAFLFFACGSKNGQLKTTLSGVETIAVKTAPVQNINTPNTLTATGLVATENEATYSFKISGVIERIAVQEGQSFKKGQLLAALRTSEINAQLAQSLLAYEKAKRDFSRAQNLYTDSVATLEQWQNAKTSVDIARQSVDAVSFNKRYASIYANADGFVTKKLANEGEIVSGGAPVLSINEISGSVGWILKLGVSDKQWASLEAGDKAVVNIDAFGDKQIAGFVSRKSLAADASNGSFQVEVKLTGSIEKPALGMFGKATIFLDKIDKVVSIPYDALIEADGNRAFVFIPSGINKVRKIPVEIESFDNNSIVVRSGLEGISHIIVSNSAFLNENSTISIIK